MLQFFDLRRLRQSLIIQSRPLQKQILQRQILQQFQSMPGDLSAPQQSQHIQFWNLRQNRKALVSERNIIQ